MSLTALAHRGLALMWLVPLAACVSQGDATSDSIELVGGGGVVKADTLSWEAFRALVYQEPDTGIFIVNGDTPVLNEKLLREFYDEMALEDCRTDEGLPLIVHRVGTADAVWNNTAKRNLTYCISTAFGGNYNAVVQAMNEATGAWENVADVDFIHVPAHDQNCTSSNSNVVFDVNQVESLGNYIARAFFPNTPRQQRNVLIDDGAFAPGAAAKLVGILRHELGHALGFRHEHTRPEAGKCFENNNWRALTPYDSASVMHYPQCNGTAGSAFNLSTRDAEGAAALYGRPGGAITPPGGEAKTHQVSGTITRGAEARHGPYPLVSGTGLEVVMTGNGDADLYVRFNVEPSSVAFDCRPYQYGSNETCSLSVPVGAQTAYIMVRGFANGSYALKIDYVAPVGAVTPASSSSSGPSTPSQPSASSGPSTPPGGQATTSVSGSIAQTEQKIFGPYKVVPGTAFIAAMSGTGDPDLYVRFGAPPNFGAYDCRPYKDGPNERCDLTTPAGATTAYVMVRGHDPGTFQVDLTYRSP